MFMVSNEKYTFDPSVTKTEPLKIMTQPACFFLIKKI